MFALKLSGIQNSFYEILLEIVLGLKVQIIILNLLYYALNCLVYTVQYNKELLSIDYLLDKLHLNR